MNKIAIAVLCVLVGGAGYFYVTDSKNIQKEIERNPQLAPHVIWRVQLPPVNVEEERLETGYLKQIAAAENKKLDAYHAKVAARHAYHRYYHRYPELN